MLFELFVWWYVKGWLDAWKTAGAWVKRVQLEFSMPELFKNLFSPWKQIVSMPGRSIDEKFRAFGDNLFSRAIGFVVRFLVLIAAVLALAATAIIGLARAVAWPLVPPAIVYFIYRGLAG